MVSGAEACVMFKTRSLAGGEPRGQCTMRKLVWPRVWLGTRCTRAVVRALSRHFALRLSDRGVLELWRGELRRRYTVRLVVRADNERTRTVGQSSSEQSMN